MAQVRQAARLRWMAPSAFAFVSVFAPISIGWSPAALGEMTCGAVPENLPVEGADQLERDVQGKAKFILEAPASTNLRVLVTASRRDLRAKHANVEKSTLDHYLLWVTCQAISRDVTLAPSQKFDKYSNFYRLMTEPIAGGGAGQVLALGG
jgi:hypothetical protein